MAFAKKTAEHALKTMARDVKAGEIPPVIVLCGKEQYLVEWSIRLILDKFVNPETKVLDSVRFSDESISLESLMEACETLSMFSERRVVIVSDFTLLAGGQQKGFSEADEAALAEYVKSVPEGTVLIFTCENPDKRKKLYKACAAAGKIYEFDTLSENDLVSFIIKQLKAEGKISSQTVISGLIADCGYYNKETDYTLYNLVNDLKKIAAYADGPEITMKDVAEVISGSLETYIFALIDSISSGHRGDAFKLFYNILGSGENSYRILSMIASQYEFMLDVKELSECGFGMEEIAKTLNAHTFRVKKAFQSMEKYTAADLRSLLIRVYDVDRNIKSGLLEQNLALEMLIASI